MTRRQLEPSFPLSIHRWLSCSQCHLWDRRDSADRSRSRFRTRMGTLFHFFGRHSPSCCACL